jgi:very-short-patch-repair endonuclease
MNLVTEFCRQLCNNQTPAEKLLWNELRRRSINGEKFLRQVPLFTISGFGRRSFYIADFYSAKSKFVVEVDGPIHLLKKEYDANRDLVMQSWEFNILRFTNDEVLNHLDMVVKKIDDYLSILTNN